MKKKRKKDGEYKTYTYLVRITCVSGMGNKKWGQTRTSPWYRAQMVLRGTILNRTYLRYGIPGTQYPMFPHFHYYGAPAKRGPNVVGKSKSIYIHIYIYKYIYIYQRHPHLYVPLVFSLYSYILGC